MENKKEKTPFFKLNAFDSAVFTIKGETRKMSLMELLELKEMIDSHMRICAHIYPYLKYYDNFYDKLPEILKDSFMQDEKKYGVGENFATFINSESNHEASDIIEKAYAKINPDHTLMFDAETSFSYVYTKDKKEAEDFLKFTYENFIKPTLTPWLQGWEKFSEGFLSSSNEKKMLFSNIR